MFSKPMKLHTQLNKLMMRKSGSTMMKKKYSTAVSKKSSGFNRDSNVADEILTEQQYTIPKQLAKAPASEVTVLNNGFRVVSEKRLGETAAVGVFIGAGSRQENVLNSGVAHFLEHMYFKGTKNRTKDVIEEDYEKYGSHLNAHTSREYTAFTSHCLKNDVDRNVSSLAEMLLDSNLDIKDIEEERSVILREMEEVEQSVEESVFDELHRTAFPNSGLGQTILGPESNIKSLTREQMIQYQKEFYTADRMALVSSGMVNHDELVKVAEKMFGHLPKGQFDSPRPLAEYQETPNYIGSDVTVDNKDVQGLHGAIGFQGPSISSGDIICINLIQYMVGAYDISQGTPGSYQIQNLAQAIGDKGLAQQVMPFLHGYSDTSLFGVKFVSDGGNDTDSLMVQIISRLTRFCYEITDSELDRAKNALKLSTLTQYDNSLPNILEEIGRQTLIFNRRPSAAEMFARLDSITKDDIKRVATKFIYNRDPVMVGVGHTKEFIDYNWARLFTHNWFA